MEHYQRAGWFTKNVFNRVVQGLTKLGVSVWGSRWSPAQKEHSAEPTSRGG